MMTIPWRGSRSIDPSNFRDTVIFSNVSYREIRQFLLENNCMEQFLSIEVVGTGWMNERREMQIPWRKKINGRVLKNWIHSFL